MSRLIYPDVDRDESVVDNYHGTLISDPYRWLEDINSEEVQDFVKEQNQLTRKFMNRCEARDQITARLTELGTYYDYECPFRRGDRYFTFTNGVLFELDSLYSSETKTVLDMRYEWVMEEGTLSLASSPPGKTGESFGGRMFEISPDANFLAFGVMKDGSIWSTIYFKDLRTSVICDDKLEHVRETCLSWTLDSKGIFYGKYPDGNTFNNQKIYYHVLGTNQSEDKLIVESPNNPNWEIFGVVSNCGNYLIVYAVEDCGGKDLVYLMDLINDVVDAQLIPLVTEFRGTYYDITNVGTKFYFLTDDKAPRGKVVCIDVAKPSSKWRCIVEEHPNTTCVLDWATCVNQRFLATCYKDDVVSTLQLRNLSDGILLKVIPLNLGTVTGRCGTPRDSKMFFKFTSFLTPGIVYEVDFETVEEVNLTVGCCNWEMGLRKSYDDVTYRIYRESTPQTFDPKNYKIRQTFYFSKDGTRIPMFLVHKKNIVRDGQNPCLLEGYGGFYSSMEPTFNPANIFFMENLDGIIAVANIRGGGEYGKEWYEAGIKFKKQNTFDDFQAAAEYLIKMNYTCQSKLAIKGNSNGGLLVGACVNQRPDLFKAAIAGFGLMDMLRFHKFTTGSCWISDYGSPEDKLEFENLLKYSPLHNVKLPTDKDGEYPAILLITSDHDERVLPLHSYKMIAELQAKIGRSPWQKNPLLMRVETNAGHADGMSFETYVDEVTDILAFIMLTLDLTFKS